MPIKFLDNMCFNFIDKLDRTATVLPISNSDISTLCSELGTDDYSYLTISSPTGTEIVRIQCVNGEIVIQRGQGDTQAQSHAKGRCACFKVNKLVIDDYVNVPDICEPTITTSQTDFIKITPPASDSCEWTIDIDEDILSCIEDICVDNCDPCVLPDGTYENATLTIRNGKVCGIANGTNIVYTGGSCCGCSSCNEDSTVTP